MIYTEIKMDYCARRNLHPGALRLDDAFRIMRLCKKRFYQWLKYPSPGIRPSRAGWREKRP